MRQFIPKHRQFTPDICGAHKYDVFKTIVTPSVILHQLNAFFSISPSLETLIRKKKLPVIERRMNTKDNGQFVQVFVPKDQESQVKY
jgi:hypothetical protein